VSPVIRDATVADVAFLIEIEQQSFSNPNWDVHTFEKYACIVAEIDGRVAGFVVSRETAAALGGAPAEHEILNLAVAPEFRRSGIATALLNHELTREAIHFLEVRESNIAAQALYRKCGFVEVGRRPEYYELPAESAIVMRVRKC